MDPGMTQSFQMEGKGNLGHKFENLVYLDLRRRGGEIYSYKTKSGYEVDFVHIDKAGNRNLYQVTVDANESTVQDRKESPGRGRKGAGDKGENHFIRELFPFSFQEIGDIVASSAGGFIRFYLLI